MSGSHSNVSGAPPGGAPSGGAPSGAGADPSMEDILASIRRILSEEDTAKPFPAATPGDKPAAQAMKAPGTERPQDVLVLDTSMLVPDPPPRPAAPPPPPILARSSVMPPAAPPPPAPRPAPPAFVAPSTPVPPTPVAPTPVAPTPVAEEPSRQTTRTAPVAHEPPGEPLTRAEPADEPSSPAQRLATAQPPSGVGNSPSASPVLVPVPLSGQSDQPRLITPPDAVMREAVQTAPAPPPRHEEPVFHQADASPVFAPSPPPALSPVVPPMTDRQVVQPADHPSATTTIQSTTSESFPMSASMTSASGIASPEATAAAAGSVSNLVRALSSDRGAQVHSGGPTIADIVREEMRPMLKAWLDSNLPPMVERLVRAEIDRVIARATL